MSAEAMGVEGSPVKPQQPSRCQQRARKAYQFFLKQYLPIALVFTVSFGLLVPVVGREVGSWKVDIGSEKFPIVQSICVILIFIIQGVSLKTDEVKQAIRAYVPLVYGVVAILFVTPWVSAISNRMTFIQQESRVGFVLFFAMPTTVNSGVTLAIQAGGHGAFALLLTVATNTLGIFTIPFYLPLLLGELDGVDKIDPVPMLYKLLSTVFVPVLLGKLLRHLPKAPDFVKRHKQALSLTTSTLLVVIPWMKVSASAEDIYELGAVGFLSVALVGIGGHVIFLLFNYACTTLLRMPLKFKKSVVILASEKTLPVAMSVLAAMPESIGDQGIIAISCVIGHLVQIVMDAFLAAHWAHYTEEHKTTEPTLPKAAPEDEACEESDNVDLREFAEVVVAEDASAEKASNTEDESVVVVV